MVKISLANRIGDVSFLNTTLFVFRLNIINIKTYLFRYFNLFQDNFDYMGCSGGGTLISSCSGGGCCTPCSSSQQQHLQVNNRIVIVIIGRLILVLLGTYRNYLLRVADMIWF